MHQARPAWPRGRPALQRRPARYCGWPANQTAAGWRSYHRMFVGRYGTGTLVPVTDVTSDAGIGYPPSYPTVACLIQSNRRANGTNVCSPWLDRRSLTAPANW
ncbi:MAG TPA: lantibiotic dehydratase [Streptosporangiaceae bacterium]|nr:lantibiotic dehydratase [Streptosporangiaceae bacterium]